METKAERFKRLANARLKKALGEITKLEKLANKSNYEYTEDQANKLLEHLDKAVQGVENAFTNGKPSANVEDDLI